MTKSAVDQCGLLVYSKLRSVEESAETPNNIAVAAYQDGYQGIGGYAYKHYLQVLKTSAAVDELRVHRVHDHHQRRLCCMGQGHGRLQCQPGSACRITLMVMWTV